MRTATAWSRWVAGAAAVSLLSACGGESNGAELSSAPVVVTTTTSTSTTPDAVAATTATTATGTPKPWPVNAKLARKAVEQADALNTADRRYAVAVYDRANHKLVSGRFATTPMMSASVIKLFVVVDILHQREQGDVDLTDQDLSWIGRALSGSDDTAMNALWSKFDGMGALARLTELAGLHQTLPPEDPGQWGEATTSAADTVAVYRYLLDSLTPDDRDLVIEALATPTHYGVADDFDQYFGFLGPGVRSEHVAAKQGWLGYQPYRLLHSTALLGSRHQFIAVVLTRQSGAHSYPDVAQHVTDAAGTILKALGTAATR